MSSIYYTAVDVLNILYVPGAMDPEVTKMQSLFLVIHSIVVETEKDKISYSSI